MSLFIISIICCALTTVCIGLLAKQNARRRRAHKLPNTEVKTLAPNSLLLIIALAPGAVLAVTGQGALLVIWLSAVTLLGWLVAITPPKAQP